MCNKKVEQRLAVRGLTGPMNSRLLSFYKANGATSNILREAEMQYLKIAAAASPDKTRNGMWKFLGGEFSTL